MLKQALAAKPEALELRVDDVEKEWVAPAEGNFVAHVNVAIKNARGWLVSGFAATPFVDFHDEQHYERECEKLDPVVGAKGKPAQRTSIPGGRVPVY